ncbi:pollen-specific leucine-rich repeat extensin-like protein 1 [Manduca sexta]|uniref:Uncharacterized protein n=1 Tax=Manduca sexta TaxID=7130 RepID=A0A922CJF1_MANSE|nr:pollen-specific leucine-rich repeat extensin-like protein 1 [Manduca sexta]KAG6448159.1 hypothetical protein O3G_MSEX005359 [Manduca sexta]
MTNPRPTWGILLFLLIRLHIVNLQIHMFPMPQPMPQIFLPPPPPIAIPIPIAIPVPQTTTTSTTTTSTTEQNVAIGVPIPMPLPIQIAVPAMPPPLFCLTKPRPKNCPPCPACPPQRSPPLPPQHFIGPAFPMPVPIPPVIGPGPLVVVPRPYRNSRGKRPWHRVSSASEDTSSSSSSEWDIRRRNDRSRRLNRKSMRNARRSYKVSDVETSDGELVKPVLTYVSKDGDVKLKRRISADEAAQLLGDKDSGDKQYQTVRVLASGNGGKQSQVLIVSDDGGEPSVTHRRKQVVLRKGASQHILGEGKKELIFRPPDDKVINNLTVSFQVI